ncbi:hypothetical protein BKA93DRAFT_882758 [Sparassis latifolia]
MRRRATNHRKREGTRTRRRITGANDARCMEGRVFYACIGAGQWNAATADLVQRRGLQKPVHVNVRTRGTSAGAACLGHNAPHLSSILMDTCRSEEPRAMPASEADTTSQPSNVRNKIRQEASPRALRALHEWSHHARDRNVEHEPATTARTNVEGERGAPGNGKRCCGFAAVQLPEVAESSMQAEQKGPEDFGALYSNRKEIKSGGAFCRDAGAHLLPVCVGDFDTADPNVTAVALVSYRTPPPPSL